ncbi:MAG TPA: tetratricopeptide repeat protein [Luteitalea sp.]|nr:tetratricopeptide repeat protein [Luteitalea sp.]
MRSLALLVLTLATQPGAPPAPPQAGPTAGQASPTRGEAYQAFLEARRLESSGDSAGAIAAFERAIKLDESPAILTELAQVYARQDRAEEARKAAERALVLNPDWADAHWMLGMLLVPASAMQGDSAGTRDRAAIDRALGHLEKAVAGRPFDLNVPVVLGRLYLQVDRPADAARVLRTVYDRENGALEAGVLYAQALDRLDQRDEALRVVGEVLAGEPRFFRARLLQAELFEKARRWPEAAAAYDAAAQENPEAIELRLRQATALLGAERAEQAKAVLNQVIEKRPTDLQARYLLAQTQREMGEGEAAEQTALAMMKIAPADVRGPVVLSQVHADRREHAKVIEDLTPVVASPALANSQSALGVTLRLANAHVALGQHDQAIAVLERARAARPESALDGYLLQTLVMARRWPQAVTVGEQVRKARPNDPQVGRMLAQALVGANRVDDAVAILEAERTRRPEDPTALLALATTLADGKRTDRALAVLADGEAPFGDQVLYWFQKGAILEGLQKRDEAAAAFRRALQVEPTHAPTLNYLGYMLVEDGRDLDEAVRLIEQAVAADPDNGSYLDSLGWALFKQGKLAPARDQLQRAADLSRSNSVIQDHLGDVLIALADKPGAIAAWERALAGDGDAIDVASIKSKIARARQR